MTWRDSFRGVRRVVACGLEAARPGHLMALGKRHSVSRPEQVPGGDQRLEAGHFDRRIDAGAPQQAAVVVLDLDVVFWVSPSKL